jgi:K+-transporting ATPase ATPase C chain
VAGLALVAFPHQATGSLVRSGTGEVVGSELIGQAFVSDRYFHPRPSAAGEGYDALASGGSNLGPTSQVLSDQLQARADAVLATERGLRRGSIPADMITASGSGLDPDISPANAMAQAPRIARTRALALARVQQLIGQHTRGRDLGIIGEPRVNVLELNLALDALQTVP